MAGRVEAYAAPDIDGQAAATGITPDESDMIDHHTLAAGLHRGMPAHVVSLPSWELFEARQQGYRGHVLPPDVAGRVENRRRASAGAAKSAAVAR